MIILEIKASTKCFEDNSVYVTFNYDSDIVNMLRALPERYYLPDIKTWEVPLQYLGVLKENFKNFDVKVIDDQQLLKDMPIVEEKEIPETYEFKTKPYSYQLEGMKYGLNNSNFILGDEQGLGKTMQVINIACIKKQLYGYKHCLIICGVNRAKMELEDRSKETQ